MVNLKTLIFQPINLPQQEKHLYPCLVYGSCPKHQLSELSMAVECAGWFPRTDGQAAVVPILELCSCINSPQRQCWDNALTRRRDQDMFGISKEERLMLSLNDMTINRNHIMQFTWKDLFKNNLPESVTFGPSGKKIKR